MAIFRDGVKIGKYDIRSSVSKQRAKGLLTKGAFAGIGAILGDDDKGRDKFAKDARGEVQTIRTVVGRGEGFQSPANFKVEFQHPKAINQQTMSRWGAGGTNDSLVRTGGLDWQTHIMSKSSHPEFLKLWKAA